MKVIVALAAALIAGACAHTAPDRAEDPASALAASRGLIAVESAFGYAETAARLDAALAGRGLKAMKIDHAANAMSAGLTLRPTTLFIFGAPRAGTPLMESAATIGIDLPMKALVVEEAGRTRIYYNDVAYLAARHAIPGDAPPLAAMRALLAAVTAEAAGTK